MRLEVEGIRQRIFRVVTDALLDGRKVNDLAAIVFRGCFCRRYRGTSALCVL
jgi:hypothetical protein